MWRPWWFTDAKPLETSAFTDSCLLVLCEKQSVIFRSLHLSFRESDMKWFGWVSLHFVTLFSRVLLFCCLFYQYCYICSSVYAVSVVVFSLLLEFEFLFKHLITKQTVFIFNHNIMILEPFQHVEYYINVKYVCCFTRNEPNNLVVCFLIYLLICVTMSHCSYMLSIFMSVSNQLTTC